MAIDIEKDKLLYVFGKIPKRKAVRLFVKIYNTLCNDCKHLAIKNPKRDIKDYCVDCQDSINPILNRLMDGLKK